MNDTTSTINHDAPVATPPSDVVFGSDAIAAMLRSARHARTSRSIPARAIAACTTASSTISATARRR